MERVLMELESFQHGIRVRGLIPDETVSVVCVTRKGSDRLTAVVRTDSGDRHTVSVERSHERTLAWGDPPRFSHRAAHHLREDPGSMDPLPYDDRFTETEMRRLRLGVVPDDMGEKWFIYCEGDTLNFHRSWTGYCIYIVRVTADGPAWTVREAWVTADPRLYGRSTDGYECAILRVLIRSLMLEQLVPFPEHPDDGGTVPDLIMQHRIVGTALTDRALGVQRWREDPES